MRRNVRRLNREVGAVLPSAGKKRPAGSPGDDGDDDDDDEGEGEGAEGEGGASRARVRGSGNKKAANLQELRRYFQAAEEAARELISESNAANGAGAGAVRDLQGLATLDPSLPLESPSRAMSFSLANNNPLFREKLKRKLEESGVTFELPMEELGARRFGRGVKGARSRGSKAGGGSRRRSGSSYYDESSTSYASFKARGKRGRGPPSPDYEEYDDYSYSPDLLGLGMHQSDETGDRRSGRIRNVRNTILARGAAGGGGGAAGGSYGSSADHDDSIILRRQRRQLLITINGGNHDMGPPVDNVSPRTRYQLSHESPFHGDPLGGGLNSLGSLMGLPIGDTPHGTTGLLTAMAGLDSRKGAGSPRFDFDEAVVEGFPSPRAGDGLVGMSPSRWTTGSASSGGSKGMFKFPESARGVGPGIGMGIPPAPGSATTTGSALGDMGPPSTDLKLSAHAKKFKRANLHGAGAGAAGAAGQQPGSLVGISSPISALGSPRFVSPLDPGALGVPASLAQDEEVRCIVAPSFPLLSLSSSPFPRDGLVSNPFPSLFLFSLSFRLRRLGAARACDPRRSRPRPRTRTPNEIRKRHRGDCEVVVDIVIAHGETLLVQALEAGVIRLRRANKRMTRDVPFLSLLFFSSLVLIMVSSLRSTSRLRQRRRPSS